MHALMLVWSSSDSIGNLFVCMPLCSFGPAATLLGMMFICMQLCSFVNAVALLGIRLSMHALMFVWSCYDSNINLVNMHALMFVWSCFGSIGNLALYACTYVRLLMLWPYWESCFVCMHLCSFVHAVTLL